MKTTDKTWRNVSAIFLIIALMFTCCLIAACDNNNGNNGGNNGGGNNPPAPPVSNLKLSVYVRNVSFEPIQTDVYYNNEVAGQSDAEGKLELTVKSEGMDALTGKIGLKDPSLTYAPMDMNSSDIVIIRLDEGMTVNDFYFFSGKVVNHSDGESALAGARLVINGTTVWTFENSGNFDLSFVHKDSAVNAVMEGYDCLDGFFHPWEGGTLEEVLQDTSETVSVVVNGKKTDYKHITGFTLRLSQQANT